MTYVFYVLAGALGGILAGMGMGGGTLTLPILVLFLGVGQLAAQFANLIAFLPSGAGALLLHAKNGLLEFDGIWKLLVPAIAGCAACSYFAAGIDGGALRKLFGGFLIVVAVASLFTKTLKKSCKKT